MNSQKDDILSSFMRMMQTHTDKPISKHVESMNCMNTFKWSVFDIKRRMKQALVQLEQHFAKNALIMAQMTYNTMKMNIEPIDMMKMLPSTPAEANVSEKSGLSPKSNMLSYKSPVSNSSKLLTFSSSETMICKFSGKYTANRM